MTNARFVFLVAAILIPTVARAQQPPPAEEQELRELMAVLEQETAIATKARMNSDYVPGIVTVFEGDELEALGFETVADALALVPGVQSVRDGAANGSVIVRGLQFPFNSGNIQILVDGVPLSRESAGLNGSTLLMPIELVDRIEFIRGPGSVIYGDFAFMGLVNIITTRDRSRVFVRPDSTQMFTGGGRFGYGSASSPWQAGASLTGWHDGEFRFNNRVGDDDRRFAGAWLRRGSLSIAGNFLDRESIDRTTAQGGPLSASENSWSMQGKYSRRLSTTLESHVTATMLDSHMIGGANDYHDRVVKAGADFQWKGLKRQSWLAAVEASHLEINATRRLQGQPGQPPPPVLTLNDEIRTVVAATLQDEIEVSEAVSVTAGVRVDEYSDLGHRVTPRLAMVWRISDRHIVKGQYAEGFRAPAFFELFGGGSRNDALEFEVNETTELNYVYRRPRSVARATLFRSKLRDMIFTVPGGRFGNTRGAHADGVELEWSQQMTNAVKLVSNVSTVHTGDNRGATLAVNESPAAADWMSDLAVLVRPAAHTIVGLHWNHVADRQVAQGAAYDLLDLTVTRQDLVLRGLGLRAGVRNALDEEIRYLTPQPNGNINTFVGHGRTFWIQLSWRR